MDANAPMDPDAAERRFAEMLDEAGLPRFDSTFHNAEIDSLEFTWDNGLTIHQGPPLHPDDVTTVQGIPCTTPSRTLIDMAEEVTIDELRAMFVRAKEIGLLDPGALRASRARIEWRPSLVMLDQVIEEFCG